MKEVWKEVIGYEGLYQVSSHGKIRSKKRQGSCGGLLKFCITKHGYLQVALRKDGKSRSWLVHRVVAMAFIPKENGKEYVNHKDGNKQNNKSDNLEWCTAQENCLHAHEVLEKNTKRVMCVETGIVYPSACSAARSTGNDRATISRICNNKGRAKRTKGLTWRFV